jgi:hypothetical protein
MPIRIAPPEDPRPDKVRGYEKKPAALAQTSWRSMIGSATFRPEVD